MKRYIPHGLFALIVLGLGFASAQNIQKSFQLSQDPTGVFNVDTNNNAYFPAHVNTAGQAGALSACGTAPSLVGSDLSGTIQTGSTTSTTCTLTFRSAYAAKPNCVASITIATPVGVSASAQGVTFAPTGTFAAFSQLSYNCTGNSGG